MFFPLRLAIICNCRGFFIVCRFVENSLEGNISFFHQVFLRMSGEKVSQPGNEELQVQLRSNVSNV